MLYGSCEVHHLPLLPSPPPPPPPQLCLSLTSSLTSPLSPSLPHFPPLCLCFSLTSSSPHPPSLPHPSLPLPSSLPCLTSHCVSVCLSLPPSLLHSLSPPHLKLEQPQGLSDDELKDLTKEIRSLARERVGEVMMLEIAQHVQVRVFLLSPSHSITCMCTWHVVAQMTFSW